MTRAVLKYPPAIVHDGCVPLRSLLQHDHASSRLITDDTTELQHARALGRVHVIRLTPLALDMQWGRALLRRDSHKTQNSASLHTKD